MSDVLFDVLIVECKTRIVDSVTGNRLPFSGSFHTVYKRLETVSPRLNDSYFCCPVFSQLQLKKGDKLPDAASDEAYAKLAELEDEEEASK